MSDQTDKNEQAETDQPTQHTEVDAAYAAAGGLVVSETTAELRLPGNLRRDPVELRGSLKEPLRFREAVLAMHGVVASDYRYKPKDRTAYAAYMRLKRDSANQSMWQAQQAYFSWLSRNDPMAWLMLDPVISVQPDKVLLEVFSKDEGVYANLAIDREAFELEGEPVCGVTNIDFSDALLQGVNQIRSYRETSLNIGQDIVELDTEDKAAVIEKKIKAPDSWLRGFLQVQSAATLPSDSFTLRPIDLYNVLRHLRLHADKKGKRRALRVELTPGEFPIIVLEPWETVVQTEAEKFTGKQAKVIRIWGRRRLMLLRRMLPMAESVEVHTLGAGLPSFWVLRMGDMTMTLGLTGFTASNWSKAVSFDLLLPRKTQTSAPMEKIVKHLKKCWFDTSEGIGKAVKLKGEALLEALQLGCQQGALMYDLANQVYRLRPLTDTPLDLERLEYRNARERQAYDYLTRKNAVKIVSENRIFDVGVELTGKVEIAEDKREYRPQMLIADEGHVSRAECTCTQFRQQGLKDGPCACLVALRLVYAEQERKRAKAGKTAITMETRTFSRREEKGQHMYQLTLDRQQMKVRWGYGGENLRLQQLRFNSVEDARAAYFSKMESLAARGYLDQAAS